MRLKALILRYVVFMTAIVTMSLLISSCAGGGEISVPIAVDTASQDAPSPIDLTESEVTDLLESMTTDPLVEDTTALETTSITENSQIRTPTPKILEENREVALLYNQVFTDHSSRLIYTASETASGGKGQGETVSLTERDFGGGLGVELFTKYHWIPVDEPIPDNEGFIIGNEDQYFFIPMNSDLVLSSNGGEKQVYFLERTDLLGDYTYPAYDHSLVMLDTYSGSTVSAIGLSIHTTESDIEKIADEMVKTIYQDHMVQEDINIYKLSDYVIVDIDVESDDETSPEKIAVYVKAIVVPFNEENTMFWYRGGAGGTWEEDDEYFNMPAPYHEYLWQKEGDQWVCTNSGTGGINVN